MRAIGEGLVKNPVVVQWARRSLIIAGAATLCGEHGTVCATGCASSVRRAVTIARLTSFEGLSPNAAELAILETYLRLAEQCSHCACQPQDAMTSFRAD